MEVTTFLALLQPLAREPLPPSEQRALGSPHPASECAPLPPAGEGQEEAEATLARARAEAAELLDDARLQAEAFREAAWQEGFHNGREAGAQATELALRTEAEAHRDALCAEVAAVIDSIGAARQTLWEAQEAEMVAFALDIARQVIKTEVTQNPEVVTSLLHNALRRVTDKDHVRVRVSVSDAARVREMRDDLLSVVDGIKALEIVDDRRLGAGGCVIETGAGTIDARIETQLASVEQALTHAVEGKDDKRDALH